MSDDQDDKILVSELMTRYLECPICVEEYDDETNVPMLLPCQHAYCSQCLEKLPQHSGSITCPQCNKVHKYESESTKYTRDLTRGDLVDFIRNKTVPKCEKCTPKRADYKCFTCSKVLCNTCNLKTHEKKPYRHHVQQPLIKNTKYVNNRCNKDGHDNGFLKFFCMECCKIVCAHGVIEEHRNEDLHEVVTADKACRSYRCQLDHIVTDMKQEIAYTKLQNKCITNRLRQNSCAEDELIRSFNLLYTSGKIPSDREGECKKFCYQVCRGRVKSLRDKMQSSEKYLEQMKKFKSHLSKTIIESKDTLPFLSKSRSEMKRIEILKQNFQKALNHLQDIMNKEVEIEIPAVIKDERPIQELAEVIVVRRVPRVETFNFRRSRTRLIVRPHQEDWCFAWLIIFSSILYIVLLSGAAISASIDRQSRH